MLDFLRFIESLRNNIKGPEISSVIDKALHEQSLKYNDETKEIEPIGKEPSEPKFKVGDTIVNNKYGFRLTVNGYENGEYVYHSNMRLSCEEAKDYHLWTKEGIREGDFLVYNIGRIKWILIFKSYDNDYIYTYSTYVIRFDDNNKFYFGFILCKTDDFANVRLATSSETNELLNAIEANGYRWSAIDKKLISLKEEGKSSSKEEILETAKKLVKLIENND